MAKPYAYAILSLFILCPVVAQGPCSSDSSVTGYSSISDLNTDMDVELARIEAGGTPASSYRFILCPDTVFDTSSTPLRPLLDGALFQCGENGSRDNQCTFEGGDVQILIEDSTTPGYPLRQVAFTGITFVDFKSNDEETGTSVAAEASARTTATFEDVSWSVSRKSSRVYFDW